MKSTSSLGHLNYSSDTNLLKRMAFAKRCRPRIDLLREVTHLLRKETWSRDYRILDVGCGNGKDLIRMRKMGFKGTLVGIDIARGILAIAKKNNKKEKTHISFLEGNAEHLSFPDASFDIVILKHCLQNVYHPLRALRECKRVLKPNGRVIIVVNGEKTRLIFRKLRPDMARIMNLRSFPDSDRHFNVETTKPLVKKVFNNINTILLTSTIRLKRVRVYCDYIDSTKSFWGKVSDHMWTRARMFAKKQLQKILTQKGEIKDYVTIGILTAIKKS